jgi:glycogen operon protein
VEIIAEDPMLADTKIIAEAWDAAGAYQVGSFAKSRWAEWNGHYRDDIRRYWRGDASMTGRMSTRLSGSSDLYQHSGRDPYHSINFLTSHDGYTLNDLVSYEQKHNLANGEDNRDGANDNYSRNWGYEGTAASPAVVRLRERMKRNFLATLAFSQGVPMLCHGDELGRTQQGNNNAYCQDNEISWIDWNLDAHAQSLLRFARRVFQLSRKDPLFRRRRFFAGDPVADDSALKDVNWIRADGSAMSMDDWKDSKRRLLGMLIHGDASDDVDERGRPNKGQTLLLLLNASHRAHHFTLPSIPERGQWRELVNTAHSTQRVAKSPGVNLAPHSLVLLCYEEMA